MQRYSENQVRALYSEFKSHKKYADKLAFFDQLFGIIPFSFPDFDPSLRFFFQKEKTDELAEIFKNERNNPGLTERKFFFGETLTFNIKPANSNSAAYSNYILSSFLSRSPVFEELIRQNISNDRSVEFLLDEANGIINKIEYCLFNEYDKSFKLQCMSVFFKGFFDAFSNRVNLPGKKRKFIELYLYAQGIIYSNYLATLKRTLLADFLSPVDLKKPVYLDLPGKLDLLNELGIIDFLRIRYSGMDAVSFENKMVEILCLLTGEYSGRKEALIKILSTINRQDQNANLKNMTSGFHNKTVNLRAGK
ncbi:MAG TPA: hypothetical protein VGZ90_08590 [Puia sp.]|jgi:hypothetical protein|nr:hypothetical protein [Puia sp.]